MMEADARSKIPPVHPALCRYVGHDYTEWGLWVPVRSSLPPSLKEVEPTWEPTKAHRERFCRRCHWGEVQNYQGEIVQQGFGLPADA